MACIEEVSFSVWTQFDET